MRRNVNTITHALTQSTWHDIIISLQSSSSAAAAAAAAGDHVTTRSRQARHAENNTLIHWRHPRTLTTHLVTSRNFRPLAAWPSAQGWIDNGSLSLKVRLELRLGLGLVGFVCDKLLLTISSVYSTHIAGGNPQKCRIPPGKKKKVREGRRRERTPGTPYSPRMRAV